jgi:hypothetical protein
MLQTFDFPVLPLAMRSWCSRRASFAALFSLAMIASFTAKADSATDLPNLEISVHDDAKVTALLVWKVGDKNIAYDLARPFSLEWVVPPAGATHFLIFPFGTTDPKLENWIPLEKDEKNKGAQNIYVSIRLKAGQVPVIDSAYAAETTNGLPAKRIFARVPTAPEGWCYVGNWEPASSSWKSIYWVDTSDANMLAKRRRVETPPAALKGIEMVADFPVRMRRDASTDSPEMAVGELVRPGARVKVLDVRYDVDSNVKGVWAKVRIEGPIEGPR